jgi:hypothetical protein
MVEVVQHLMPVSRTTVETDARSETRTFEVGKPVAYTSDEPVYVDGTLFKAGDLFVTGMPKGATWNEVEPKERAAIDAGKDIKDDLNLDTMSATALTAYAASKQINLGDAKSKPDIIAVIRSASAPAL